MGMTEPQTLEDLAVECVGWAEETFPDATVESVLAHLKHEVEHELTEECEEDELADVFMLLMHLAYKRGINMNTTVRDKLIINMGREWSTKKNDEGFFQHKD